MHACITHMRSLQRLMKILQEQPDLFSQASEAFLIGDSKALCLNIAEQREQIIKNIHTRLSELFYETIFTVPIQDLDFIRAIQILVWNRCFLHRTGTIDERIQAIQTDRVTFQTNFPGVLNFQCGQRGQILEERVMTYVLERTLLEFDMQIDSLRAEQEEKENT